MRALTIAATHRNHGRIRRPQLAVPTPLRAGLTRHRAARIQRLAAAMAAVAPLAAVVGERRAAVEAEVRMAVAVAVVDLTAIVKLSR